MTRPARALRLIPIAAVSLVVVGAPTESPAGGAKTFPTKVKSFKYVGAGVFKGRIASNNPRCTKRRKVKLIRIINDGESSEVAGKDRTNVDGRFKVKVPDPGRGTGYDLFVRRIRIGPAGQNICDFGGAGTIPVG